MLLMNEPICISINEASQVGEARRKAARFAGEVGFKETEIEKIALIITEFASNLVKHTNGGGQLLIQPIKDTVTTGIEILSLDKGPGIRNINESLRDGYSTAGSQGNGLGSIKRLSTEFEIYSQQNTGTALLSRLHLLQRLQQNGSSFKFNLGAVCLPRSGEDFCGDNWAVKKLATGCQILIVDGVGHGYEASVAAKEAVRIFNNANTVAPAEILDAIHRALRGTRGAAAAVAQVNFGDVVRYAGIGNTSGVIISDKGQRHLVSHNGTAGHNVHKIHEFTYPFEKDSLLVLHTDGLQTRWNIENYPGLAYKHPCLIAGALYRDFTRGTDDVTVMAVKET